MVGVVAARVLTVLLLCLVSCPLIYHIVVGVGEGSWRLWVGSPMAWLHSVQLAFRYLGLSPVMRLPMVWCTHVALVVQMPGSRIWHLWFASFSTV